MVCEGIESIEEFTIETFLAFPTTCDYFFYAKVMGGFFIIISMILYFADEKRVAKSDMISAFGVSGICTIVLSLMGTLVGFIQTEIFILIAVPCMIFIVIWFFKR